MGIQDLYLRGKKKKRFGRGIMKEELKQHCFGIQNCKGPKILPNHNFMNPAEDMTPQRLRTLFIISQEAIPGSTYLYYFPLPPSSTDKIAQTCIQINVVNYRIYELCAEEPNDL